MNYNCGRLWLRMAHINFFTGESWGFPRSSLAEDKILDNSAGIFQSSGSGGMGNEPADLPVPGRDAPETGVGHWGGTNVNHQFLIMWIISESNFQAKNAKIHDSSNTSPVLDGEIQLESSFWARKKHMFPINHQLPTPWRRWFLMPSSTRGLEWLDLGTSRQRV